MCNDAEQNSNQMKYMNITAWNSSCKLPPEVAL